MRETIFLNNDNVIEVDGLQDSKTGNYVNSATVELTIEDTEGVPVTGETWPIPLIYVNDSNGVYRANLIRTLGFEAGSLYVAKLTADGGSGLYADWSRYFRVLERR